MSDLQVELPRLPRRRNDAHNLRPVEPGAWIVACELAVDEAEQSTPAQFRGVLALVRKLVAECKRKRTPYVTLARSQIAELLGFAPGPHAEESVRRLLRRAERIAEVMTFRNEGDKCRYGVKTHKFLVTRLLWRLDALPRPDRLRALEDPHVRAGLEALERAAQAAQEAAARADIAGGAQTPGAEAIDAPAGPGCVADVLAAPQAHTPPSGGGPVSGASLFLGNVPGSSAFLCPPRAREAAPDGAGGGVERPSAGLLEPVGPAPGPEARGPVADELPPAVLRGNDGRVAVDLERLRGVQDRCRALLAELRSAAAQPPPVQAGGRRWRSPDDELRDRAQLAAARDREREVARLTRLIADAKLAARIGWKLHAASTRGGEMFTNHGAELRAVRAQLEAATTAAAEAPPAWARLLPAVRRQYRDDNYGPLRDLAALRCVADTGDALLFRPADEWHRARVRDCGLAGAIGAAARELLGRDLVVEVLEAGNTGLTGLEGGGA